LPSGRGPNTAGQIFLTCENRFPEEEKDVASGESFVELLQRLRAGDPEAAALLVQRYAPAVRRALRFQLRDPGLAREVDGSDILQSALASFFTRAAAAGGYKLETSEQLQALLIRMARNKLRHQLRKHRAQRRDGRRVLPVDVGDLDPEADRPTPSRIVASRELLQAVRQGLNAEERQIADLRAEGASWAEVAARLGGTPDGRRMQHSRALGRVSRELGLDEE
jgi:RNA polymerase sigma factor (sigma-70 family)